MTLRGALDQLPADRDTQLALRDILTHLQRHHDQWIARVSVQNAAHGSPSLVDRVLSVLTATNVVDSDGDPPRFLFKHDRALEFEIERFMRKADTQSTRLRTNVERFRTHYGAR